MTGRLFPVPVIRSTALGATGFRLSRMSVYLLVDVLDWMAHGIIIFGAFLAWIALVIVLTPDW